jgi:hypothetical protein
MFVTAGAGSATKEFGAKNSTPECIGKHFFILDHA